MFSFLLPYLRTSFAFFPCLFPSLGKEPLWRLPPSLRADARLVLFLFSVLIWGTRQLRAGCAIRRQTHKVLAKWGSSVREVAFELNVEVCVGI